MGENHKESQKGNIVSHRSNAAVFFKKVLECQTHANLQNVQNLKECGPVIEAGLEGREEVGQWEPASEVSVQDNEVAKGWEAPAAEISDMELEEADGNLLGDNAPSFLKNEKLRLVVFGGKGGTGKTTSSCATAIYLARTYPEKRFLVASSDPAHSVGDSFDCAVSSSITSVEGVNNLFAVEMDSQALLEKFKNKYKFSIENFSNMSFSTDQIDIREFLQFKLPGMQEMAILLEIVSLLKFGIFRRYEYDFVIWDTAPTGHTLRLLELPDKVLKWIELFETSFLRYSRVAIGAATIGFKIPGNTPSKGNVRTFLDTLSKDMQRIRMILRDAETCEFVPVTIPEELSIAETARLLATLKEEGVPVHNVIVNHVQDEGKCVFCSNRKKGQEIYLGDLEDKFSSYNLIKLPVFSNEVRGKERLLNFGECLFGNSTQYSPPQSILEPLRDEDKFTPLDGKHLMGFQPGMLSELLNKDLQFIIFGGKGGVGKTTVSAATAVAVAEHNPDKKVLVFSTDPAHSLSDSFATPIGDAVTAINRVGNVTETAEDSRMSNGAKPKRNLYALEIDGAALYQDFRKEYRANVEDAFKKWQASHLAGGRKWKLDFDEKVMVEFVDSYPPGLEEVLALEKIMGFIKNADFDIYIFDTAPTGHLIELLKFPESVRQWLRVTYRAILKYHREVPVDNIEAIAKKILASQETVQKMHALLTNPQKSEFVAVTIPEAMGILETEDLLLSMSELGIPCSHVVINMVIPPTDCNFCSSKRDEQMDYIRQVDAKTEYREYEAVQAPLYPHEIRGIENLTELSDFLYEEGLAKERNG